MPGIKFFYQQYGDSRNDLAKRIKDISDELQLLNQLISHGKQFVPNESVKIGDYRGLIHKQINALSDVIASHDFGMDHYEISQGFAQFNAHSLAVLDQLKNMDDLPSLDNETEVMEACVGQFKKFEENLSDNPGRKEIMHALKDSAKLLQQINESIQLTRENPLVGIAECWFEGAQVAQQLGKAPKPTM